MAAVRPATAREGSVAAILTLLVPGAGHAYAGALRRGAVLFAALNGIYAAGLLLSGGAAFGLSQVSWFFPLDMLPEIGNVGATLLARQVCRAIVWGDPAGGPWREGGLLLTALSGVGAALAAADAHDLARRGLSPLRRTRPSPGSAAALSFLLPGLGHLVLGRKGKGILLFAVITLLFGIGLALSAGTCVDRDRHGYYWAGQILNGGATSIVYLLTAPLRVRRFLPYADAGLLFVTASGLLNVLVMIDAYATASEPSR